MSVSPAAAPPASQAPDDAVPLGPDGRVASPCINVCRMDSATGWCEGCLRSIDEIAAWAQLGEVAKREVWSLLDARRVLREASRFDSEPGAAA